MQNPFLGFGKLSLPLSMLKNIKGGLVPDDDVATCSTTCKDGSTVSLSSEVASCNTIANAGAGETAITYTNYNGTQGTKKCPTKKKS